MCDPSTWLMVLALGRMLELALVAVVAVVAVLATLFLRARLAPGTVPLALSRRLRGRDEGVVVWCSFCW